MVHQVPSMEVGGLDLWASSHISPGYYQFSGIILIATFFCCCLDLNITLLSALHLRPFFGGRWCYWNQRHFFSLKHLCRHLLSHIVYSSIQGGSGLKALKYVCVSMCWWGFWSWTLLLNWTCDLFKRLSTSCQLFLWGGLVLQGKISLVSCLMGSESKNGGGIFHLLCFRRVERVTPFCLKYYLWVWFLQGSGYWFPVSTVSCSKRGCGWKISNTCTLMLWIKIKHTSNPYIFSWP